MLQKQKHVLEPDILHRLSLLYYFVLDFRTGGSALCRFRLRFDGIFVILFLSSPELKTQVSFSDHLLSGVCQSVRLSVNFSHFHLFLQNHWTNFNQTWHKASLGKGDSSLFKGDALFQREIVTKLWKYIDEFKNSSSLEPLSQFQPNYAQSIRMQNQ